MLINSTLVNYKFLLIVFLILLSTTNIYRLLNHKIHPEKTSSQRRTPLFQDLINLEFPYLGSKVPDYRSNPELLFEKEDSLENYDPICDPNSAPESLPTCTDHDRQFLGYQNFSSKDLTIQSTPP